MKAWFEVGNWRIHNSKNHPNRFTYYYGKKRFAILDLTGDPFLSIDEVAKDKLFEFIKDPPFSIYRELWDKGEWNENYTKYEGLRLLVKSNRMNYDDAELLNWSPKFREWASRLGFRPKDEKKSKAANRRVAKFRKEGVKLGHQKKYEVTIRQEFEDLVQLTNSLDWYQKKPDGTLEKLPRRAWFPSIEFARRLYALGRVDLWTLSSYSWGAVIECIGDAWYSVYLRASRNINPLWNIMKREAALEPYKNRFKVKMKNELRKIWEMRNDPTKNVLVGAGRTTFHLGNCTSDEINPMHRWYYQRELPTKFRDIRDVYAVVDKICETEISARYIRLQMTCGPENVLNYEKNRLEMETDFRYSEYLASGVKDDIESMTFDEALNTIATGSLTLSDLGMQDEQTYFKYHGILYGLHLSTRKVWVLDHDLWYLLPDEYYTSDYDAQRVVDEQKFAEDEARNAKIEEAKKRVYYAMRKKGKSHYIARRIVKRVAEKFKKKEDKEEKYLFKRICSAINKKAIPTLTSLRKCRLSEMWADPICGVA